MPRDKPHSLSCCDFSVSFEVGRPFSRTSCVRGDGGGEPSDDDDDE